MNTAVPGSELTKEPFRWDQRLFGVVLRMAAAPPVDVFTYIPSADDTAIHAMCEVTGGKLLPFIHPEHLIYSPLIRYSIKCKLGWHSAVKRAGFTQPTG